MLSGSGNKSLGQKPTLDQLITERRSIRKYKPDMPPQAWIEEMIQCAAMAPSPSNTQPVRFVGIASQSCRETLRRAMISGLQTLLNELEEKKDAKRTKNWIKTYYRFSEFMFSAPLLFAVGIIKPQRDFHKMLAEAGLLKNDRTDGAWDITAGLALKAFLLKGEELGLGSCILTAPLVFVPDVEEILGLKEIRIRCFVTAGFPDETPKVLIKKTGADIYHEI
jgi:nitroreductase